MDARRFKNPMVAYTDGSFVDRKGGWGFVILQGNVPTIKAYGPCTKRSAIRNIGGEIEAAEKAIQKAIDIGADFIQLHHDYEGIGRWGDGDWQTNRDETTAYADFVRMARERIAIEFVKVKGHVGDKYNEMADRLAEMGVSATEAVYMMADGGNVEVGASETSQKHITFAEMLKAWRKDQKLTQAAAVKASGLSGFGKLERGEALKLAPSDLQALYQLISPKNMGFVGFLALWAGENNAVENVISASSKENTRNEIQIWCDSHKEYVWDLEDAADGSILSVEQISEYCQTKKIELPFSSKEFADYINQSLGLGVAS